MGSHDLGTDTNKESRQASDSMACVLWRLRGTPETKGIGNEMHVSSLRVAQQKVRLHEAP